MDCKTDEILIEGVCMKKTEKYLVIANQPSEYNPRKKIHLSGYSPETHDGDEWFSEYVETMGDAYWQAFNFLHNYGDKYGATVINKTKKSNTEVKDEIIKRWNAALSLDKSDKKEKVRVI
jgi:hypothetical protein